MERQRIKRTWGVTIAGVCLLILGVLLAVCMGAMKILPVDIWNGIFHNTGSLTDMMIRDVRLPRVICVLVTGGILGMTGAMMQGVTRNPIAEPSVRGRRFLSPFFMRRELVQLREIRCLQHCLERFFPACLYLYLP